MRTTYGEWAERTRRLAGVLDELGISADGRVGTFAWNTARHLELYFAAPCSGRVLHTLNIRLFPDDIVYIADHAEDEIVFVDRSLLKIFWPLMERFESVQHVVVMDDGGGDEVPDDPRVHDYEELLAKAEPVDFPEIDDENRAAAMCYTSGTTGHPKGVVYSHRSTVLHSMGSLVADAAGVSERDTIMPVVPMFHANAWGLCQAAVMAGASLALPGPKMQPAAIAELMESEKVTLAAGVPTIWMGVLPELEGRDLSSLREILCGGSAVPRSLSEAYREKIGLPILQAWGMTETSPVATTGRIKSALLDRSEDELADLRAAQGLAIPLVDLRIVEPGTDDELPWDGEARGELQARGPWIAAGYYNDDRSSDSFTEDGWLRTGDVATISPNGYVRLVDRTKDLVKSGGEWISSVELENAIMAHPKVAEAAVIGIPDEKWSERPLACVVPEGDAEITLDELKEFLAERVPKWWIPNDLEIIDEVPKTSVGKFSKKTLREQFASTTNDGLTRSFLTPGASLARAMMRAVVAVLLVLLTVPAAAAAETTPDGPATLISSRIGSGFAAVGYSPHNRVLTSWTVTVGPGGRAGTVRPLVGGVVGDPVELPATPGTYTFALAHARRHVAARARPDHRSATRSSRARRAGRRSTARSIRASPSGSTSSARARRTCATGAPSWRSSSTPSPTSTATCAAISPRTAPTCASPRSRRASPTGACASR